MKHITKYMWKVKTSAMTMKTSATIRCDKCYWSQKFLIDNCVTYGQKFLTYNCVTYGQKFLTNNCVAYGKKFHTGNCVTYGQKSISRNSSAAQVVQTMRVSDNI